MTRPGDTVDAIAIVGMAGRFPGAASLDQFWDNLRQGVESITFFTEDELIAAGLPPEHVRHPLYVKAKGVLDGVELFDAQFFGYTPKEAQLMDPQHRMFLECGWHALEDAGCSADLFHGSIGVFAGAAINHYLYTNILRHPDAMQAVAYDKDFLPTRLSYKLNLTGPSMAVQTACSTSLVAVCQACQSLLSYQCDMAMAGGTGLSLPAASGYFYQEGSILSPDGHCRPFDARARGTVMGSGVGVVVLKRLDDALADGDRIRAVIRGFAVNNDGAGKMGYTAPSIDGQAQVIRLAQALAAAPPDTISYVEAHGTGTEIGDPIEIAALTQAFRSGTSRTGFCAIGSVKSNIGHLDTAAGIASLIKTVLALEHRALPPTLHFEEANPKIDFENSPFRVNTRLTEWPAGPTPRRAGVSSFGIGGTNAHVVLEEAPARQRSIESPRWQLLTMSARSEAGLDAAAADFAAHLRGSSTATLADTAYTAHVGRKKLALARAVVCRDAQEAAAAIEARDPRRVISGVADASGDRPIVFMFPGQGAQYPGMSAGLYQTEAGFRRDVDQCCEALRPQLGFDLRDLLYPSADLERAADRLRETLLTQAALFVVEYALARLWMGWGIRPAALVGHSIGEYVAACISGALTLEDALRLVVVRGRLMEEAPAGGMLAVPLGEARVRELLDDGVSIAAVNASTQCVVAGGHAAIDALEKRLVDEALMPHRLRTGGAFHSALMDGVAEPLTAAARGIRFGRPRIPYVSNVTGGWIGDADLQDPTYWGRHVRETVRFDACLDTLLDWGAGIFLEVGPGQALGGLVRQQAAARGAAPEVAVIASLPGPQDPAADGECMTRALGRLWVSGAVPDWHAYHAGERRLRVDLPLYRFERKRYWADVVDSGTSAADARRDVGRGAPARQPIERWFAIPSWSRSQPRTLRAAAPSGEAWLALVDPGTPGALVADALERRGHAIVRVRTGGRFAALDGEYSVDPQSRDAFASLIADLRTANRLPRRALHLWLLGSGDGASGEAFDHDCRVRGFDALLHLAQAWGDAAADADLRVDVVADGTHDVTGRDELRPGKATVLGPVRVMPQEYSQIRCRLIDVPASDARPQSLAFARLVAELESEPAEPVVALRGIDRWAQSAEPMPLEAVDDGAARIRQGGVYLITGGYGAMGLAIARSLAPAHAKLVLVGRRGAPPRESWRKHVALHGREDAVSRAVLAIQALEDSGAEVLAARADVASAVQMREVVADAKRRFGRIDGVVHAAGVAGGGVMQLRDPDSITAVMRPKVEGTRVLGEVLAGEPLDFFVLCSSMNAVTGGAGQVDYCAANAYLDAFARARMVAGALTVSINWDSWREGGMAAAASLPADLARAHQQTLERGLASAEGVDAFRRCLASGQPQVLVSTSGWDRVRDSAAAPAPVHDEPVDEVPLNPRPSLATPYVAPQDEVDRHICEVWRDALGVERVGVDDSFFDLGGHSLLAVQVVGRLNADFGTSIPVAKLYEGLTPAFFGDQVRGAQHVEPAGRDEPADRDEAADRTGRLTRQKQHQERRRVIRTGHRRLVQ